MREIVIVLKLALGFTTHAREAEKAGDSGVVQSLSASLDRSARDLTLNFTVLMAAFVLVIAAIDRGL